MAVIQLLGGVSSAVGILVALSRGSIDLDFGVLGIPAYFGLMRLSSGWRTYTLVFLWFGLLLAPVGFCYGLAAQRAAGFGIFGIRLAQVSPVWLSIVALFAFVICLWQYRVLTRPEIRALFLGIPDLGDEADPPGYDGLSKE